MTLCYIRYSLRRSSQHIDNCEPQQSLYRLCRLLCSTLLQLNYLTLQAKLLGALQNSRQCIAHITERLDAVVKCHNTARLQILHHTSITFTGCNRKCIISRKDIPHNNLVSLAQSSHLRWCYTSIRWTKEFAMKDTIGKIHILDILLQWHTPPLLVRICVVTNLVAFVYNSLHKVGIHLGVLTQHEECGLGIIALQRGENPLCNTRGWPIVEGKKNSIMIVQFPNHIGKYSSYESTWIYLHITNLLRF